MAKKIYSIFTVSLLFFLSCSNDAELISSDKDKSDARIINLHSISVKNSNGILSFENEMQLKEAARIISDFTTPIYMLKSDFPNTNLTEVQKLKETGFRSMYDVFVDAMNEAESYYDRAGGYEEFKIKYSTLYFPEKNNDYSAYLPVSNKDISKLLNPNGEVIINGKIVNYKDITSYEQLIDLGVAPAAEENTTFMTKAVTAQINRLDEVKHNDRKLWAKVYTQPGSGGVAEVIVAEVCFRKKGFLGAWYNYSSETTFGFEGGDSWSKSGYSSHDYKWAREFNERGPIPFGGKAYILFRGFGEKYSSTKNYFDILI